MGALPKRRASRSPKASAVTSWSSATRPRSEAASWIGPQGAATDAPTSVDAMVAKDGTVGRFDGLSYTPGEYASSTCHHHRGLPAHRGHDVRLVRQPDRAVPQE